METTENKVKEKKVISIEEQRSKQLKEALKMVRPSYVFDTLLGVKRNYFYVHLEDGVFKPHEVEIMAKAGLIKK